MGNFLYAQEYQLANQFSTKEGLPSNHIYDIIEDNSGFLWITSDNGIARFDGKNFYLYTVKNGLPSNDVLQIIKDNNGTIWANCYKELPSYFDTSTNTFVAIQSSDKINTICNALLNYSYLPNGAIRFFSDYGFFDIKNRKAQKISLSYSKGYLELNKNQLSISVKDNLKNNCIVSTFLLNDKVYDSLLIPSAKSLTQFIHSNRIYNLCRSNAIYVYSNFKQQPFSFHTDFIKIQDDIKWYKISDQYLSIISKSGSIYIYNLKNLQFKTQIKLNYQVNSAYIDKKNRLWIGTLDNGVLYYNLSKIKSIVSTKESNKTNFLSVAVNNESLFAGNYNAEIFTKKGNSISWSAIQANENDFWVRKLIPTNTKLFALSDAGYCADLKRCKVVYDPKYKGVTSFKTGVKLNDSILLLGTLNGLCKLTIQSEKFQFLHSSKGRILNMIKKSDHEVYYVAAQGVFLYNYHSNNYQSIALPNDYKRNKPSTLAFYNQLLWVATVKGDLLVIKDNKPIYSITNDKGLPENISCMLIHNNTLWIASKSGIYILNYTFKSNKLQFTIHKLSKSDGLNSDVIQDLAFHKDTIYAATTNGISAIPSGIQFERYEINPTVVSLTVNNKKMQIRNQYSLQKDDKNIIIELAGVELSGHFKNFQYSLNDKNNWVDLHGATLNLSLKGGENNLYIRAKDVNNNISRTIKHLKFDISIPFYNSIWFLGLLVFALTGIVFWIYNQRKLNHQKIVFQQKMALEQQRSKIIADLHDDIGATLSSLQINSAVAHQLVEKKPSEALKVLEKIESQSKNLADKIGDIIWSMKPGKDEFMVMSTRIKNFANDILGATNINYQIDIDKRLDKEITNFSTRKNIVLFVKEAINNAAKYSQASKLTVSLYLVKQKIHVSIEDNGIGFNPNNVSGNGITNMKRRIEELQGTFEISSQINVGTKIEAKIPFIP
ncbi:MAG: hypothetical protein JNJ52_08060 [Flavobacterium sp.]|nr:hypothetical protein [Flavobacterium sp.]